MAPGGAQAAGAEVDNSFFDDLLNENDFSNAINLNNNNNSNVGNSSMPHQNLNSQQSSRNPRNNKSKFDIYLPNI
jgi:hypothetical protein